MPRWLSALAISFLCWSFLPDARALNITLDSKSIPGLTPKAPLVAHTLRITGRFEQGDGEKLRVMLVGLKGKAAKMTGQPLATAELSSSGGDLLEGMKVGYLFREFEVATLVRKGDICLSACALAFLGGTASRLPPTPIPSRTIEIGGQVGFHNFTLDSTVVQNETKGDTTAGIARGFGLGRAGASALIRYAADLGIDAGFIAQLLVRPPDTWLYIDTDEMFLTVGACPSGPEPPLGRLELQAVNICNHATGGSSIAEPSQARSMTAREAKRYLLEQVQRNVESVNVKGPLVGQLAGVLASRDDRLIDSVYSDLRAAGISLPEQIGRSFIVSGYAFGELQADCQVNLSASDPDKFDFVLIVRGAGLSRPFALPPPMCPGLFRYDGQQVLNPKR
ncbi:hypothetical protein [uncultured Reyranella sp.]|uniref:hypothetical protein n=1 Tax=uncultured Reyranella sp. TaxID=735512 RepID=UPI0025E3952D|nr:hypothetical protein [uncultured Reyranella sp.]